MRITSGPMTSLVLGPFEAISEADIRDLHVAFRRVADRENWKLQIRGFCHTAERDAVNAAIIWFAGGSATFLRVPGRAGLWAVEAPGYYNLIGA